MIEKNVMLAKAYYQSMSERDLSAVEKKLHPEIHLISPFGELIGKDAVLTSIKELIASFKTLTIRASFGSGDQAMLVIDLTYPATSEVLRTAVFMTFKDDLIVRNEIFFDARCFIR